MTEFYPLYAGLFGFIIALGYCLAFNSDEKEKYFFVAIIYFLSVINIFISLYK